MSEIQLAWVKGTIIVASSNNFVNCNAHERVMLRRRPVIEVVGPFCVGAGQQRKADNTLKLHNGDADLSSESSETGHNPLELSMILFIPEEKSHSLSVGVA